MNGTDKDLAAHFTIINKRGRCLYGTPIEEAFAEVPGGDWALEHLPAEYHPLIAGALREYSINADIVYDDVLAKRYAEYAIKELTQ